MSTSAESAKQWVDSKQPSTEQIQEVVDKLEKRIEAWDGDEESIQGSIEALDYLSAFLVKEETPSVSQVPLDTSNLIPDSAPVELEQEVKEKTFAELKAQLGIAVKK
ncbi:hypothetical protein [Reinekea blandensis]|uniref:Uncharacterized protein n=1 Tax=Reinekea blandensis MED297 TaxID=314283 RepID=A4BAH9_9GAMM|nr:hypothetical protein [Reinekea blandensis]EAR10935.1 hypothetical protein MED297_10506 [Reinekea sp. MED297] [Reinekea blandensis MED297]